MKLSKEFIAMFREEAKKAQWEINRWNGKSIDDLVVDYLERKELKLEDFKDVVVLTVEEAKDFLGWLLNSKWRWNHSDFEYAEDWRKDWIEDLKARIAQAEGK